MSKWQKKWRMAAVAGALALVGVEAEARDFQKEIDAAAARGGGTVTVPAGEWVTHGLRLKTGVTLNLAEGARLVATTNLAAYAHRAAFIYAENAERIAIIGKGTIYGNGDRFIVKDNAPNRPCGVCFYRCRDFRVEGVRLEAPAFWTLRLLGSDKGVIRGVKIFSHVNFNNDGIDIEASNLLVEDCDIDSDDDAICFKSDLPDFTVENVEVRNCCLSSNCNAIKFGTSWVSKGRNLRVHDCTIKPLVNSPLRNWHKTRLPGGAPNAPQTISAVAIESVDGGWLEDVTVRNITFEGVQTPIVVREGARHVNPKRETRLRNILIENISGSCLSRIASSITGLPDKRPQGITLRNAVFTMPGGATAAMTPNRPVPEVEKSYPENRMFNHILPAWGIYIRHADGVTLDNVTLRLAGADVRKEAVIADDTTGLTCTRCNFTPVMRDEDSPAYYVDPFIGTEGSANCFPNACVPFGMIQNGPSSGTYAWKYCGGYHFEDKMLYGFVQDGISGTGGADLGDLLIQPFSGKPEDDQYRARKGEEEARPGYYSVRYPKSGITARGTCSEHVAFWNFHFDRTNDAHLMLDLQWGHTTRRDLSHRVRVCEVAFPDAHTMTGHLQITQWVKRDLYFCMRFNRPAKPRKIAPRSKGAGERYVFDIDFKPNSGYNFDVKIALSANSVNAAIANMDAEVTTWHFNDVAEKATAKWNAFFSRMKAKGPFEAKRNFYTAMWHLAIAPNNIADCGEKPFYSTLSTWDTFRAAHPLFTIITPERVTDMVNSTLRYYDKNGFMPIWALWGEDNQCMIGTHSIPIVADAYLKGFTGVDWERIYQAAKKTVTTATPGRVKGNFDLIDKYGYYPCDIIRGESVSRLLECAYDDWCLAKMAEGLGHKADAAFFLKRSENWRNVFDPSIKLVRGRKADGSWRTPFNPAEFGHGAENDNDFTEGNSWQYTWHVMQNPYGLIEAFGGRKAFVAQLDKLFTINDELVGGGKRHDITGLIGQYVHGNEPSHHVIYFYPFAGEPRKTAEKVREVCDKFYRNGPYGLSGNDDCGQMSAWYLFSAMGFYPFNPCGGEYVLGAPQFPEITLALPQGKTFRVVAKNLSERNKFVKSVTLNGKPLKGFILRHADLMRGGELVFKMEGGDDEKTRRILAKIAGTPSERESPRDILVNKPDYVVFVPKQPRDPKKRNPARPGDTYNDHFHVISNSSNGYLYAFWTQASREADIDQHIAFTRSSDKGLTWDDPVVLAGSPNKRNPALLASWQQPMLAKSGRLYVLWNQQTTSAGPHCGLMFGAFSDNDGATWSAPKLVPFTQRMDADPADDHIPPSWCNWQRPLRLGRDGRFFVGCSRHGKAPYDDRFGCKIEFWEFQNIDANPRVEDIRLEYFSTNKSALSAANLEKTGGFRASEPAIEEAAPVKLPDGRLFALMRSSVGSPVWVQSRDGGRSWSQPKILCDAKGKPFLHPRSPCPLYDWKGPEAASGQYFALIHQTFDFKNPKGNAYQKRGPLYLIAGRFDPNADQPIVFAPPKLFAPRPDGNSFYASYCLVDGTGVLWYNDMKFYLCGRKIGPEWFE